MSGHGLTSPYTAPEGSGDNSRFSDSETDDRSFLQPLTTSKSSDLLSGVYRGFKKITPAREDFARLARQPSQITRQPSQLALRVFPSTVERAATSAPLPSSRPPSRSQTPLQHARSLSLQNSLEKPLPEPPSQVSPTSQLTPTGRIPTTTSLAAIVDSEENEEEEEEAMESRSNTMESSSSVGQGQGYGGGVHPGYTGAELSTSSSQSSLASLTRQETIDDGRDNLTPRSAGPLSAGPSPQIPQSRTPGPAVGTSTTTGSSAHLSGLMCNVHRTTGREPHPLVGATTTVLGDKLYVFGGRILSRSRPASLTSDLYELDLIRRHWTKVAATGDIPPPRYFHSVCALGDTKLVCYGGMSPMTNPATNSPQEQQGEITVMSDIHIFDAPTKRWTYIPTHDHPQGRYAHCACILPSAAAFSSHKAPLSALKNNPSTGLNEGRIGVNIDGSGGAEMIVVGGQDGNNHYIEQISVFNLRSLKWTSTQPLGKSCGAYRSVVAPLPPSVTAKIGKSAPNSGSQRDGGMGQESREPGSSMLVYSNYNFLDVKLELQIRSSDGTLSEKPMSGTHTPPGLRFPNGGIIDTFFVVSGTYLTSSKQEYALWALDLRNLSWSRIDAGGVVFSQGSWNRGVLWNRRNTFVVLGNRKRSLVEDYNHRRINFSNVCMVELEAFGFYDNPRKTSPMSGFVSASSPYTSPGLSLARKAGSTAGGRYHSRAAEELGEKAMGIPELCDMDILCLYGERIPINSRIVARRWGPYFVQLLREGTATQDGSDATTLRSAAGANFRNSIITITPSSRNTMESDRSGSTMPSSSGSSGKPPSTAGTSVSGGSHAPFSPTMDHGTINSAPTPRSLPPNSRPRCLYLPHMYKTVQALLHYLYTSSLPPSTSQLCTPQILCSLLQIARPYRIDGLLEAVIERLHTFLDNRNAAAVFNATAMAAGGGRGIDGSLNPNFFVPAGLDVLSPVEHMSTNGNGQLAHEQYDGSGIDGRMAQLRINTAVPGQTGRPPSDELSATGSVSASSDWSASEVTDSERSVGTGNEAREVWSGELSSVIGLQKRGLRGLMEGRRLRERTGTTSGSTSGPGGGGGAPSPAVGGMQTGGAGLGQGQGQQGGMGRVGLGIAGGA